MLTESASSSPQSFEELSERYRQLSKQQIQAQTNLENAQKQLNELKVKAREEYGTDDLNTLREKLEQMKRKNEKDCANYQQTLDAIESQLQNINDEYDSTNSSSQ